MAGLTPRSPSSTSSSALCSIYCSTGNGWRSRNPTSTEALGSEAHAAWALVNLHADGLIHRCNEFVFPTRAAVRFHQLEHT